VPTDPPVLVGCAHGTRDPAGRRAIARLRLDAAALRPGVQVVAANVDVHKPALDDVVARLSSAGRHSVVVPLLLSAGYHMATDVARAVGASNGLAVAAPALGPDEALADALADRLLASGYGATGRVVLAAAGSSDACATGDVDATAALLSRRLAAQVTVGYLSAATPSVADAVADACSDGEPVSVATYLLAPGFLADRLARVADQAGAVRVSAPLAPHAAVARLVLRRYDEALTTRH